MCNTCSTSAESFTPRYDIFQSIGRNFDTYLWYDSSSLFAGVAAATGICVQEAGR